MDAPGGIAAPASRPPVADAGRADLPALDCQHGTGAEQRVCRARPCPGCNVPAAATGWGGRAGAWLALAEGAVAAGARAGAPAGEAMARPGRVGRSRGHSCWAGYSRVRSRLDTRLSEGAHLSLTQRHRLSANP